MSVLTGCASVDHLEPQGQESREAERGEPLEQRSSLAQTSPAARERTAVARRGGPLGSAVAAENGLEVRKLVVQDLDGMVAVALAEFGERYAGEGTTRMQRNGFELYRLREQDLDQLMARLGPPLTDVRTWHGQAPGWRDLLRHPARSPIGVVVDGRPKVLAGGTIRLLVRAWTLPMEDEVLLEAQLRVLFEPTTRGSRLLPQPSAAGPGAAATEIQSGESLGGAIDLHLASDEAWVLTCIHPRDQVPSGDDANVRRDGLPARPAGRAGADGERGMGSREVAQPESPPSSPAPGAASSPRERKAGRGPLPDDHYGPGASLPPTVGALLLSTEIPATRTLYVLIGRLPIAALSDDRRDADASPGQSPGRVADGDAGDDLASEEAQAAEGPPPEPRLRGVAR